MKSSVSGPSRIRQLNRTAVLSHIRLNGKNSRLQIGKELGLSAAAITSVVSELLDEGLLIKSELIKETSSKTSNKAQGRPISNLELNPNRAHVFGILLRPDANKCVIESAWADYTGEVFTLPEAIEVETNHFQSIIDGIEKALKNLKKQIPANSKVYGISIGIPGVVENQTIPIAPKLSCIEDPDFISTLYKTIEYPISFENDVNLGAMSELQNQPRLRKISFAYLHLYTGVGSTIVLEGHLLKGRRGWAGEIGQLTTRNTNNQPSTFETLLSINETLGDLLENLGHPRNELELLIPYIDNKDPRVVNIIGNYCNDLFNLINVLHSVLDLDEIIIDFPSTKLLNKLISQVRQHIAQFDNPLVISLPSMEHQAHLEGAALNALNLALESIEKRDISTKK